MANDIDLQTFKTVHVSLGAPFIRHCATSEQKARKIPARVNQVLQYLHSLDSESLLRAVEANPAKSICGVSSDQGILYFSVVLYLKAILSTARTIQNKLQELEGMDLTTHPS